MQIIFVRHGQSTQNVAIESGVEYNQNNVVLTERGEKQAKETGKYLKEIYSNFDKVYCSTLTRCIQTCDFICKELGYKGKIIKKDYLRETWSGNKTEGMSKEETKEFLSKNKELINIQEQVENEKDPYKKVKLLKKGYENYAEYVGGYSREEASKNLKKFLRKIKKLNCKRILVVTHGGIIELLSKIITKISIYNDDIIINMKSQSTFINKKEDIVDNIETSNCHIFGLLLEDSKYEIVIPQNNLHLRDIKI